MPATTKPVAARETDPVFIALGVQKKAFDLLNGLVDGSADEGAALRLADQTRADTTATVPTTPEGMLAYIDMLHSPLGWEQSQIDYDDLGLIFATFRTFVTQQMEKAEAEASFTKMKLP